MQRLVQAARSAAQPAAGEEISRCTDALLPAGRLSCCLLLLPILPPPSLNRRARQPSCPVLLAQWGHCGWGAAGGCAGAEMQKSSTVRTPTGPTSSCITCCKPEQPEDCSKSHSSCGNEIAESRDRRGRGGEGSWQASTLLFPCSAQQCSAPTGGQHCRSAIPAHPIPSQHPRE